MDSFEIVGLLAGSCTTIAFLPQVLQVWRSRSAKDISLGMYAIFCVGVSLWFLYGFLIQKPAIMITNGCTLVLATSVLIMKLRWR